ncbi:hypothetical protein Pelo_8498 [Pelomyxa schiedti]|nr:hypothetical protein Pelo_8498 [Pelomyxa schiedti]
MDARDQLLEHFKGALADLLGSVGVAEPTVDELEKLVNDGKIPEAKSAIAARQDGVITDANQFEFNVCYTIERILVCGLRKNFFGSMELFDYLRAIPNYLPPHDVKACNAFLNKVKQIGKSPQGKSRVFVRGLLNNNLIADYLNTLMWSTLTVKFYGADSIMDSRTHQSVLSSRLEILQCIKFNLNEQEPALNKPDYWNLALAAKKNVSSPPSTPIKHNPAPRLEGENQLTPATKMDIQPATVESTLSPVPTNASSAKPTQTPGNPSAQEMSTKTETFPPTEDVNRSATSEMCVTSQDMNTSENSTTTSKTVPQNTDEPVAPTEQPTSIVEIPPPHQDKSEGPTSHCPDSASAATLESPTFPSPSSSAVVLESDAHSPLLVDQHKPEEELKGTKVPLVQDDSLATPSHVTAPPTSDELCTTVIESGAQLETVTTPHNTSCTTVSPSASHDDQDSQMISTPVAEQPDNPVALPTPVPKTVGTNSSEDFDTVPPSNEVEHVKLLEEKEELSSVTTSLLAYSEVPSTKLPERDDAPPSNGVLVPVETATEPVDASQQAKQQQQQQQPENTSLPHSDDSQSREIQLAPSAGPEEQIREEHLSESNSIEQTHLTCALDVFPNGSSDKDTPSNDDVNGKPTTVEHNIQEKPVAASGESSSTTQQKFDELDCSLFEEFTSWCHQNDLMIKEMHEQLKNSHQPLSPLHELIRRHNAVTSEIEKGKIKLEQLQGLAQTNATSIHGVKYRNLLDMAKCLFAEQQQLIKDTLWLKVKQFHSWCEDNLKSTFDQGVSETLSLPELQGLGPVLERNSQQIFSAAAVLEHEIIQLKSDMKELDDDTVATLETVNTKIKKLHSFIDSEKQKYQTNLAQRVHLEELSSKFNSSCELLTNSLAECLSRMCSVSGDPDERDKIITALASECAIKHIQPLDTCTRVAEDARKESFYCARVAPLFDTALLSQRLTEHNERVQALLSETRIELENWVRKKEKEAKHQAVLEACSTLETYVCEQRGSLTSIEGSSSQAVAEQVSIIWTETVATKVQLLSVAMQKLLDDELSLGGDDIGSRVRSEEVTSQAHSLGSFVESYLSFLGEEHNMEKEYLDFAHKVSAWLELTTPKLSNHNYGNTPEGAHSLQSLLDSVQAEKTVMRDVTTKLLELHTKLRLFIEHQGEKYHRPQFLPSLELRGDVISKAWESFEAIEKSFTGFVTAEILRQDKLEGLHLYLMDEADKITVWASMTSQSLLLIDKSMDAKFQLEQLAKYQLEISNNIQRLSKLDETYELLKADNWFKCDCAADRMQQLQDLLIHLEELFTRASNQANEKLALEEHIKTLEAQLRSKMAEFNLWCDKTCTKLRGDSHFEGTTEHLRRAHHKIQSTQEKVLTKEMAFVQCINKLMQDLETISQFKSRNETSAQLEVWQHQIQEAVTFREQSFTASMHLQEEREKITASCTAALKVLEEFLQTEVIAFNQMTLEDLTQMIEAVHQRSVSANERAQDLYVKCKTIFQQALELGLNFTETQDDVAANLKSFLDFINSFESDLKKEETFTKQYEQKVSTIISWLVVATAELKGAIPCTLEGIQDKCKEFESWESTLLQHKESCVTLEKDLQEIKLFIKKSSHNCPKYKPPSDFTPSDVWSKFCQVEAMALQKKKVLYETLEHHQLLKGIAQQFGLLSDELFHWCQDQVVLLQGVTPLNSLEQVRKEMEILRGSSADYGAHVTKVKELKSLQTQLKEGSYEATDAIDLKVNSIATLWREVTQLGKSKLATLQRAEQLELKKQDLSSSLDRLTSEISAWLRMVEDQMAVFSFGDSLEDLLDNTRKVETMQRNFEETLASKKNQVATVMHEIRELDSSFALCLAPAVDQISNQCQHTQTLFELFTQKFRDKLKTEQEMDLLCQDVAQLYQQFIGQSENASQKLTGLVGEPEEKEECIHSIQQEDISLCSSLLQRCCGVATSCDNLYSSTPKSMSIKIDAMQRKQRELEELCKSVATTVSKEKEEKEIARKEKERRAILLEQRKKEFISATQVFESFLDSQLERLHVLLEGEIEEPEQICHSISEMWQGGQTQQKHMILVRQLLSDLQLDQDDEFFKSNIQHLDMLNERSENFNAAVASNLVLLTKESNANREYKEGVQQLTAWLNTSISDLEALTSHHGVIPTLEESKRGIQLLLDFSVIKKEKRANFDQLLNLYISFTSGSSPHKCWSPMTDLSSLWEHLEMLEKQQLETLSVAVKRAESLEHARADFVILSGNVNRWLIDGNQRLEAVESSVGDHHQQLRDLSEVEGTTLIHTEEMDRIYLKLIELCDPDIQAISLSMGKMQAGLGSLRSDTTSRKLQVTKLLEEETKKRALQDSLLHIVEDYRCWFDETNKLASAEFLDDEIGTYPTTTICDNLHTTHSNWISTSNVKQQAVLQIISEIEAVGSSVGSPKTASAITRSAEYSKDLATLHAKLQEAITSAESRCERYILKQKEREKAISCYNNACQLLEQFLNIETKKYIQMLDEPGVITEHIKCLFANNDAKAQTMLIQCEQLYQNDMEDKHTYLAAKVNEHVEFVVSLLTDFEFEIREKEEYLRKALELNEWTNSGLQILVEVKENATLDELTGLLEKVSAYKSCIGAKRETFANLEVDFKQIDDHIKERDCNRPGFCPPPTLTPTSLSLGLVNLQTKIQSLEDLLQPQIFYLKQDLVSFPAEFEHIFLDLFSWCTTTKASLQNLDCCGSRGAYLPLESLKKICEDYTSKKGKFERISQIDKRLHQASFSGHNEKFSRLLHVWEETCTIKNDMQSNLEARLVREENEKRQKLHSELNNTSSELSSWANQIMADLQQNKFLLMVWDEIVAYSKTWEIEKPKLYSEFQGRKVHLEQIVHELMEIGEGAITPPLSSLSQNFDTALELHTSALNSQMQKMKEIASLYGKFCVAANNLSDTISDNSAHITALVGVTDFNSELSLQFYADSTATHTRLVGECQELANNLALLASTLSTPSAQNTTAHFTITKLSSSVESYSRKMKALISAAQTEFERLQQAAEQENATNGTENPSENKSSTETNQHSASSSQQLNVTAVTTDLPPTSPNLSEDRSAVPQSVLKSDVIMKALLAIDESQRLSTSDESKSSTNQSEVPTPPPAPPKEEQSGDPNVNLNTNSLLTRFGYKKPTQPASKSEQHPPSSTEEAALFCSVSATGSAIDYDDDDDLFLTEVNSASASPANLYSTTVTGKSSPATNTGSSNPKANSSMTTSGTVLPDASPSSGLSTSAPVPPPQKPKHLLEQRPEWMPDGNAKSCPLCHDSFSLSRRKHHCRKCGQVFDAKCCAKVPLPQLGYTKPVLVCKECKRIFHL